MLKDKVILVTGAGRGVGRDIALLAASQGAKVVVNDLGGQADGEGEDKTPAMEVVGDIKEAGGEAVANYGSVADFEMAEAMIQQAVDTYGKIDGIVNNAGILRDVIFHKMTEEEWDIVIDVHLKGCFNVARAAATRFREQKSGAFVHMTSTSGLVGNFGQANYGAAKMGMLGIMNVLAIEGLSKNIKVNCLAPAAETRLIGTIPGVEVDPDNPDPMRHPQLVTPAVLLMCAEDAPTNKTIHAGNGRFSSSATFVNEALEFGVDVTYEDLLEKKDQLLDLSNANEMSGLIRVMKAQKG